MQALLRAGAQVTVVNVFTCSDYAVDLTTVPGGKAAMEAVSAARRLEDEAFVADLARCAQREPASVLLHDLHWLDAPLRLAVATESVLQSPLSPSQVARQADQLAEELRMLASFEFVFAPLALGDHIDHRIAREAARLCMPADRLCWYEDLPYAARMSDEARRNETSEALHQNAAQTSSATLHVPQGSHQKERFARYYPSQIAVSVAEEMARYAAGWSDAGSGAERWWALSATCQRIAQKIDLHGRLELS